MSAGIDGKQVRCDISIYLHNIIAYVELLRIPGHCLGRPSLAGAMVSMLSMHSKHSNEYL